MFQVIKKYCNSNLVSSEEGYKKISEGGAEWLRSIRVLCRIISLGGVGSGWLIDWRGLIAQRCFKRAVALAAAGIGFFNFIHGGRTSLRPDPLGFVKA